MKNLRDISSLPVCIISSVALATAFLLGVPGLSTAQAPQAPGEAANDERASIGQQPAAIEAHEAEREAALRQAEDDLLKKLSASLPSSASSGPEGAAAIVVSDSAKIAAEPLPSSSVLSERVGSQAPSAWTIGQTKPAEAAVAPLAVCPPCAALAAAKPVSPKKPSRAAKSGRKETDSSFSVGSVRDEFAFHGRSGSCSESIDEPYVPTSQQARVVTARAHLRIAPGRSQSSIFMMPRNAIVSIESRNGQWYRVVTATGIRGWLASSDVIFDVDVPESSTVKVGPYNGSYEPTGIKF